MTAGGVPVAVHTVDEAAVILRVKPNWLERQAAARRIPFTMLGGSYRFTAEHLAAIVRQYEQRPVMASADESARTTARRGAATRLSNDIKVKPLRPRPWRAA
jgi:excisionase family DNA binding protein